MKLESKRELWIDYLKTFACIFIVLGHFFQSMTAAEIIPEGDLFKWFNQTIYFFHVPLFFICSGYLYQKYSKVNSLRTWKSNVFRKLISLGIPYFIFSIISVLMKNLAGNYVNIPANDIVTTLLIHPMSPYWFLYSLFFIFLLTPTISSKKQLLLMFAVSLLFKIALFSQIQFPYVIDKIFDNEFWFVSGMGIVFLNETEIKKHTRDQLAICGSLLVLFIIASISIYAMNIDQQSVNFILGLLACISFAGFFRVIFVDNRRSTVFDWLSRYTLPIFLMHTIFASGLRILLLKIHIVNPYIHIVFGIAISLIGPILTMMLLNRLKPLSFVIYPYNIIQIKKRVNTVSK